MPKILLVPTTTGQRPDFQEIAQRVQGLDVECVPKPLLPTVVRASDIVVSSTVLRCLRAEKVYCGTRLGKIEEIARLAVGGVPTVPTFRVDDVTDEQLESITNKDGLVLLKPEFGSQGHGVELVPAEETPEWVGRRAPNGFKGGFTVQRFVHTGEPAHKWRVLALFGEVLYSVRVNTETEGEPIVGHGPRRWQFEYDDELGELCRKCSEAVPEIPQQAVDIVRCAETGKRYVVEINSGGYTWHFTTHVGKKILAQTGQTLYDQFDALEVAARALENKFGVEEK